MARLFVFSDDMTVRVEVTQDDETGMYYAACDNCGTDGPANLVADTHEQWSEEDTVQAVSVHLDSQH